MQLESRALVADAKQTSLCAYLSVIALAGVGLNALAGWWWADPVAAFAMVPIIAKEGLNGVRGEPACGARRIRMGTICSPSAPVRDLVPLLAIPSGETVGALDLPRRARHRTVGTEDATVACLWPQNSLAAATLVEEHAGIGRHLERLGVPAFRAA